MDIKITTQYGLLGAKYTQSQMKIDNNPVQIKLDQIPPQLDIHNDYPQVNIDFSETLADIGYKKTVALASDSANQGLDAIKEGTARVAQEGDAISNSYGQGTRIFGDIGWNNSFDNVDFNVDVLPHIPPKISFTGGLKMSYSRGQVKTDVSLDFFPKIHYTPGSVKIYLEKEPKLKIETVGKKVDLSI